MKKLAFTKMHGIGNDYIYIDTFKQNLSDLDVTPFVTRVSARHFGIGADGVVFITPSARADAKMEMYNADGSRGKMCGNAIRCVAKYLYDNNIKKCELLQIETDAGIKKLKLFVDTQTDKVTDVEVDMGAPIFTPTDIPVDVSHLVTPLTTPEFILNHPLQIKDENFYISCVSMGNPHCVIFSSEPVENLNLSDIGPLFEKNELFPEQINTEFVNILSPTHLHMRVWERGSGETLACGTGACAIVACATRLGLIQKNTPIRVSLTGGDLIITYNEETTTLTMFGGCSVVFEGSITYETK